MNRLSAFMQMNQSDTQAWAQLMQEQEQRMVEALAECARAGAKPDAVETLAAALGLSRQFEHARRP